MSSRSTAGEARTGIDAVLDQGSVLSGRLFDEQGNPLPNTQIAIYTDQGRLRGLCDLRCKR
jgi:hypothetical protein